MSQTIPPKTRPPTPTDQPKRGVGLCASDYQSHTGRQIDRQAVIDQDHPCRVVMKLAHGSRHRLTDTPGKLASRCFWLSGHTGQQIDWQSEVKRFEMNLY